MRLKIPIMGWIKITHKSIKAITEDIEALHFNKAVARLYEFTNAISARTHGEGMAEVRREAIETLILLLAPMMPHLSEELWSLIGHKTMVVDTPWPSVIEELTVDDTITMAIQINGKVRDTIEVAKDADANALEAAALASEKIQRFIDGLTVRKVIAIPGKIVNIVAN